jgi:hypothetical protein
MEEELGLPASAYEVLECRGPYRYDFPPGRVKEGFLGQEQTYFRGRLRRLDLLPAGPVQSPEFCAVRWIKPVDFHLSWVADFKRDVYRLVLSWARLRQRSRLRFAQKQAPIVPGRPDPPWRRFHHCTLSRSRPQSPHAACGLSRFLLPISITPPRCPRSAKLLANSPENSIFIPQQTGCSLAW